MRLSTPIVLAVMAALGALGAKATPLLQGSPLSFATSLVALVGLGVPTIIGATWVLEAVRRVRGDACV